MQKSINIDKVIHKMKLIDTPGFNKNQSAVLEHIEHAHVVIAVYDVTGNLKN
jgi:hypothetical protein